MSSERLSRLFHGMVLAIALGCGAQAGDHTPPPPPATAPSPSEPDSEPGRSPVVPSSMIPATFPGAPRPDDCESAEQFSCERFALYSACAFYGVNCDLAACRCDASRPITQDDCDHPQQFHCQPDPYVGYIVGCECDATAPVQAADCDQPQQFQCATSDPEGSCACNPDAPLDASACPSFQRFACRSDAPPTDCRCLRGGTVR